MAPAQPAAPAAAVIPPNAGLPVELPASTLPPAAAPAALVAGVDVVGNVAGDGTTVTVEWGKEYFQAVQYNGFDVGPFKASTRVREGETIAMATVRLHRELAAAAQALKSEKSQAYVRSLVELGKIVDSARAR